jgi:hypothetical protein
MAGKSPSERFIEGARKAQKTKFGSDDRALSERFTEAARKADAARESSDRAFKKVVKPNDKAQK